MMKPYLEVQSHHIACHIDDNLTVRLPKYDMEKLYQLLYTHYRKDCELNQSTWNGAVAVMEDGFPKIVELLGSYTCALHRAKEIHRGQDVPTVAYALVGSHGIAQEDLQETEDEETPVCQTLSHISHVKGITRLEDFI